MMRPLPPAAVIFVLLMLPAGAEAASNDTIYRCGHSDFLHWTYDIEDVDGAGIFNVTSRGVRCTDARRVARNAYPERPTPYRGWRCRYQKKSLEYQQIRCTRPSGRMVRWESGA